MPFLAHNMLRHDILRNGAEIGPRGSFFEARSKNLRADARVVLVSVGLIKVVLLGKQGLPASYDFAQGNADLLKIVLAGPCSIPCNFA
jgi:hypothetical protein